MRIHPLSPLLANQIAAGEVIERPVSVVKELLENSLDANASKIDIVLAGAGTRLIKITDDGCGIHPDDFMLALTSHATSKISQLDDLFSITSLGFRGEALASICAVARCQLISKLATHDTAYKMQIAAQQLISPLMAAAHPQGTTVIVEDLFFNTPVRRKFLYSDKTELKHSEYIIKRIALSRFAMAFKVIHDDKLILHLPAVAQPTLYESRVRKVFGATFLAHAVYLDVTHHGIRLWGWVGLPSFMRSQNDLQYCYLNGRIVRDKLINHALRVAYEASLYPGRQPAYVLYLEMAATRVDVNVHPTKHEVRFCEPRQVHDFIVSQISRIINTPTRVVMPSHKLLDTNAFLQDSLSAVPAQVAETSAVYASSHQGVTHELKIVAWLPPRYWLLEHAMQHILADYQHYYQTLIRQQLQQDALKARPLLVPLTFTLQAVQLKHLTSYFEPLAALGLVMGELDPHTLVIRDLPLATPYLDLPMLLKALLAATSLTSSQLIEIMVTTNRAGHYLTAPEITAIVKLLKYQLMGTNSPYFKIMDAAQWSALLT